MRNHARRVRSLHGTNYVQYCNMGTRYCYCYYRMLVFKFKRGWVWGLLDMPIHTNFVLDKRLRESKISNT